MAELPLIIEQAQVPSDVIALQEHGRRVKCTGYKGIKTRDNNNTTMLDRRNIPEQHKKAQGPKNPIHHKIHNLNTYGGAKEHNHNFESLMAAKEAAHHH